jgi:hypothetical protein
MDKVDKSIEDPQVKNEKELFHPASSGVVNPPLLVQCDDLCV